MNLENPCEMQEERREGKKEGRMVGDGERKRRKEKEGGREEGRITHLTSNVLSKHLPKL